MTTFNVKLDREHDDKEDDWQDAVQKCDVEKDGWIRLDVHADYGGQYEFADARECGEQWCGFAGNRKQKFKVTEQAGKDGRHTDAN